MVGKTVETILAVEFIYCGCKCGKTRSKYNQYGREAYYITGHYMKGRKQTEEWKQKMKIVLKGRIISEEWRNKISKSNIGRKWSEESKKRMSERQKGKNLGENNSTWKGDKVGYGALHLWVKYHLPKTEFCQICNLVPPQEVSNKSHTYIRDLKDWWWLCVKCHREYDDNFNKNFKPYLDKLKKKMKKNLPYCVRIFMNNFFKEV